MPFPLPQSWTSASLCLHHLIPLAWGTHISTQQIAPSFKDHLSSTLGSLANPAVRPYRRSYNCPSFRVLLMTL